MTSSRTFFPTQKLDLTYLQRDESWTPVVLVSCGSFNPPTKMHISMFHLAQKSLLQRGMHVCGAYMSPVHDAYGKAGLVLGAHRVAMCQAASVASNLVMVDEWEVAQEGYTRTLEVLRHVREELVKLHADHKQGADVPRVLLLCGGDVLATMAMPGVWKDPHILLEEFGVVCLERGEHRYAEQLKLDTDYVSTSFISVEGSFGQILGLPPTGTSQDISDSGKDSETASPLKDFLRRFKDQIFFVDSNERDGQILTTPDLSSTIVRVALKSGEPVHDLIDSDVEAYIREHALYRAPC